MTLSFFSTFVNNFDNVSYTILSIAYTLLKNSKTEMKIFLAETNHIIKQNVNIAFWILTEDDRYVWV